MPIKKNPDGFLNDRIGEISAAYAAGASLAKISDSYNTTAATVQLAMRRHGIPTRPTSLNGRNLIKMGRSIRLGCSLSAETRALISASMIGKPSRNRGHHYCHTEEAKEKIGNASRGANNAQWRGGSSFGQHGPGFSLALKREIRKRDDCLCQYRKCYIPENGRKHSVHHIDYDKTNHEPVNLITLCLHHHVITNTGDHEYWTEYYQAIQRDRGYSDS